MLILVIAVIVAFLIPVFNWYKNVHKYKSLAKVPGPKPIPILGNFSLLGNKPAENLKSLIKLQEKYGNFYKMWVGPELRLVINKPEYLEDLLNSSVHLAKSSGYDLFRPWLGDGILVSTGDKWRSRRKMITPTFHFKILEEFMLVFNYQIDILLDNIRNEMEVTTESIDIKHFVNLMALDIICETAFGTSIGAQKNGNQNYVRAVNTFLEIFVYRFFSGWMANPLVFRFSKHYNTYVDTLKTLHEFTDRVIKTRREEFKKPNVTETDDGIKVRAALLDMLLQATVNGVALTDEEIRHEVDTFMFEGHDTSAVAICFTLYALAQNPHIQEKVYQELVEVLGSDSRQKLTLSQINDLKYLDIVVKECMRVYQPVPLIERNIEKDWIIDGIKVPKNTTVAIFLYGMNRDPNVFPNPDKFDPERFLPENQDKRSNFAYIPFSAGPRNCVGQRYALYELKTCVAKFLLEFKVAEDPRFKPEIGTCSVLKSLNGYKLYISSRN